MLEIVKAGVLDTIQDLGRYGFQDIGVNPNGAMDQSSSKLANLILGNSTNLALLEIHFPAPTIKFHTNTIICLTGANFTPCLNNEPISLNQCILIEQGAKLSFNKPLNGRTCYLGIKNGFDLPLILNSRSTNLSAQFGGFNGRSLKKGDLVPYFSSKIISLVPQSFSFNRMPNINVTETIKVITEWEWSELDAENKHLFLSQEYSLAPQSNRMGFYGIGNPIFRKTNTELISYPQTKGLIQLLPSGKLLILMADHPTTGGYPRLGLIEPESVDFFSQMEANQHWKFVL